MRLSMLAIPEVVAMGGSDRSGRRRRRARRSSSSSMAAALVVGGGAVLERTAPWPFAGGRVWGGRGSGNFVRVRGVGPQATNASS